MQTSKTKDTSTLEEPKTPLETSSSPLEQKKSVQTSKTESSTKAPQKVIVDQDLPKKVSGLSLKSIATKKKHKAKQLERKEADKIEILEAFTEAELLLAWDKYIKHVKKKGRKILASNLAADRPKLEGTIIKLELPNDTMKKEIELEQGSLMAYLKEKLRNTDLQLEIMVNEEVSRKYAFTPIEKYNKLKEKNPLIEKLKETFDLDI